MDSMVAAAARSLSLGDPLGALKWMALRRDPAALALRGIALAQLTDYPRARQLLRQAAQAFGPRERFARARCQLAEAEIALADRDLQRSATLPHAIKTLESLGDASNGLHARLLWARWHLLVGDLAKVEKILHQLPTLATPIPPPLVARIELTRAELALRHLRSQEAAGALARAATAARQAAIPALQAEVTRVQSALQQPVARRQQAGQTAPLTLAEVEALFASGQLIVDGCRRNLRRAGSIVDFHRRPVLLSLALELAARWPAEVPRDHLITTAFQVRQINESHRARLRVELSRLRRAIRSLAQINATPRGFVLVPAKAAGAIALIPPVPDAAGALLALLAGGEAWTTSALACALGDSQRTVQRALQQLEAAGTVRAVGQGRTRRWLAPSPGGFATTLLLPGPPALG